MNTSDVRNLESVLAQRRENLTNALNLTNEVLLVFSGQEIGIPGGLDSTYPFLEHPDFLWLAETRGPGHVLAYDPNEGWVEFFRRPSMDDLIWTGAKWDGRGRALEDLTLWLKPRIKDQRQFVFLGSAPANFEGITPTERDDVAAMVWHIRRAKDAYAIEQIEEAISVTAIGFEKISHFIRPGISEREIAAEFHYYLLKAGADSLAFSTIVGTGNNSAILHFEPTERIVKAEDWILVDGGVKVNGYASDITRMFPAAGKFTGLRAELYAMLHSAQVAAINRCVAAAEWVDLHKKLVLDLAKGLKEFGVIKGSPEAALETGAVSLFMPHGLGHMFGLGVRDASGHSPDRNGLEMVGLARPRCNFPLLPGYTMTVEPGCYFISPLLQKNRSEGKFMDQIDYELALGKFAEIGGARIEDDIVVGDAGKLPRVLTAGIPK